MSNQESQSPPLPALITHHSSLITRPSPVAVITGAGQGLGEALTLRLAQAGYAVAAADVREEGAQRVARQAAEQHGVASLGKRTDVTSEADVAALFARVEAELGPVELLVANAGILQAGETATFPLETWRRVIDVNLTGYFVCAREAARVMVPRRRGVILQINSKSGKK